MKRNATRRLTGDVPGKTVPFGQVWRGVFTERNLVRLCASLSLLLILMTWLDVSAFASRLLSIDPGHVLLALAIIAVQFALACARWVFILNRQRACIGSRGALAIFGIGTLANLFLVTSIAGMSVRAALLVRKGCGISRALASVSAERIAAMVGLALCGAAGLAYALPVLNERLPGVPGYATAEAAAALLLGGLALGLLAFRKLAWAREFALNVWTAFSSFGGTLFLTLSSAAVILLGFAAMAVLASGMGLAIDPVFFISVMPAVALVSALPISIGGWGVREGMMVGGLAAFSVPADSAMALSVSYGLAGVFVTAILGGYLALLGLYRSDMRGPGANGLRGASPAS